DNSVTFNAADTTPPTVSITAPANDAPPTGDRTINVTANIGDPGSGLTGSDDTISGTAGGTKTVTVSGGPSTYTVAVSGMTTSGTVIATIPAGMASDAAGNGNTASTSTDNSVTFNAADTTSPTVSITAPANGAPVSGTISVTANASDNVGVAGVQFKLDGANLGTEDTAVPYSRTWDTTAAANGSTHTLTAVARDAAGNTATSDPVTVTISNGPPSTGGDVFVSLDDNGPGAPNNGVVQWHNPDGSLRRELRGNTGGQASSVAFDAAGNLYVPHWCQIIDAQGTRNSFSPHNTFERW